MVAVHRARLGLFNPAPLRSPLFRRWLLASAMVNVCLWAYLTGLTWTLLSRTGSAATVSLVQTLMTVPLPLVMLPAGLLTDRFGSRRVMAIAYAGYATCVGLTGLLVLGDNLPVGLVLGLAFVLGSFDALNVVASPVFVGRSVAPDQMGAAIGLSILSAGFGRIAGGPLGGALVGAFGPSAALLPACGILLLALVVLSTLPSVSGTASAVRWRYGDLVAGFSWARRTPIARLVILLGATVAVFVSGYSALLAIADRELIGGGAAELGFLTAAGGIGMIVAAFFIDAVGQRIGRLRTAIGALLAAACLLLALGHSHGFGLSALIVALLAASVATYSATANMLLQSSAPGALRGRAVALYGLVFYALQPFGIVGLGIAADHAGIATVFTAMFVATVLAVGVIIAANRSTWAELAGRVTPALAVAADVDPVLPRSAAPSDVSSEPAPGS